VRAPQRAKKTPHVPFDVQWGPEFSRVEMDKHKKLMELCAISDPISNVVRQGAQATSSAAADSRNFERRSNDWRL
jgi:hypothetical protein